MSGCVRVSVASLLLALFLLGLSGLVADQGRAAPEKDFPVAALDLSFQEGLRILPPRAADEPLGMAGRVIHEGGLVAKWRRLQQEIDSDTRVIAACRKDAAHCRSPAALHFIAMIDTALGREGRARIGEINRAVNLAIRAVSDWEQHGVADRWSAPLETLSSGKGDCEDYAIVKLVALREAGVAETDLRLLIVHETGGDDHAVLAVRFDDRWLVLDNRHLRLVEIEYLKSTPLFVLRRDEVQSFAGLLPRIGEAAPALAAAIPALGPSGLRVSPLLI